MSTTYRYIQVSDANAHFIVDVAARRVFPFESESACKSSLTFLRQGAADGTAFIGFESGYYLTNQARRQYPLLSNFLMNLPSTQADLINRATEKSERAVAILRGLLPSETIKMEAYTDVHEALLCLYAATAACQTLERWRAGCPPPAPEIGKPERFWEG